MSDDDIQIDPHTVSKIGGQLKDMANEAVTDTNKFFDSQTTAAKDNPGFASGPTLVDFATKLHTEVNGFINDLAQNAEAIVDAAQTYQLTDADNAGLEREISALNGQTKPVLPGL